uniref:Hyaluronidase n=1 Tax=Cyprinus carpio TaxID=7962 RepID=A0A8C1QML6_CYPCA
MALIGFLARMPLLPSVWNAPTESCCFQFKVDLELSVFDIVANRNETLSGPNVTIFYHNHLLGYYPYYTSSGIPISGGLPQNKSLSKHLSKGSKDIYRNKSKELIRKLHSGWPQSKVEYEAKELFERAGQVMNSTPDLLKSSANTVKCVHYRVKEAMQIASFARNDYTLPVFVYSRPFYAYTFVVPSESDLVHTIGESAALGAAGVVLRRMLRNCLTVKKYTDGPLGPYVINVTSAAKLCSKALCKKNSKCVRKSLDSGTYLHLNPCFFNMRLNPGIRGLRFHDSGYLSNHDILDMKHKFTCQCYQGWMDIYCEMPQITDPVPSHPRDCVLGELLLLLSLHFPCLSVIMFLGLCLIIKRLIL